MTARHIHMPGEEYTESCPFAMEGWVAPLAWVLLQFRELCMQNWKLHLLIASCAYVLWIPANEIGVADQSDYGKALICHMTKYSTKYSAIVTVDVLGSGYAYVGQR